jgi:nucleoside-diphosphate-sugar epimerase
MNKNVLLLGCNGYIGNAIAQRLLKQGYNVKGIDNELRQICVSQLKSFSATPNLNVNDQEKLFCQ